jgi:hypothetical protein
MPTIANMDYLAGPTFICLTLYKLCWDDDYSENRGMLDWEVTKEYFNVEIKWYISKIQMMNMSKKKQVQYISDVR